MGHVPGGRKRRAHGRASWYRSLPLASHRPDNLSLERMMISSDCTRSVPFELKDWRRSQQKKAYIQGGGRQPDQPTNLVPILLGIFSFPHSSLFRLFRDNSYLLPPSTPCTPSDRSVEWSLFVLDQGEPFRSKEPEPVTIVTGCFNLRYDCRTG